ncbi:MAG TPA: hypothetical protein VNN80_28885 [Polyangiaceae bacterium]|nr:hypothetical protein [Polyangiaceae bacterium]
MSNARKLVPVNSPTLVLKRSEVFPQPTANDVLTASRAEPSGEQVGPGAGTRLAAFVALCGVAAAVGYGAYSVYACLRDSFAVPTILSPSSPEVAATTLKLGELHVERVRAVAEIEGIDADLAGAEEAVTRLRELKRTSSDALHWTSKMTSQKANLSTAELEALESQKRVIGEMLAEQQDLTRKAQKDVEAGLISRSEFARQQQALSQVQLALLDNTRAMSRGQSALVESQLAQQALSQDSAPQMPELVTRQEQMIRVDLEIVRIDAEKRAKIAQRDALVERVAQVDEMVQQIEERPLFQAQERELELAFVPYTQLEGVSPGAEVYSCLWGLVWCQRVGSVAQMVPGEVVQADPWGSQVRGEYVVLNLTQHEAARGKTLRIRSWGRRAPAAAPPGGAEPLKPEVATEAR